MPKSSSQDSSNVWFSRRTGKAFPKKDFKSVDDYFTDTDAEQTLDITRDDTPLKAVRTRSATKSESQVGSASEDDQNQTLMTAEVFIPSEENGKQVKTRSSSKVESEPMAQKDTMPNSSSQDVWIGRRTGKVFPKKNMVSVDDYFTDSEAEQTLDITRDDIKTRSANKSDSKAEPTPEGDKTINVTRTSPVKTRTRSSTKSESQDESTLEEDDDPEASFVKPAAPAQKKTNSERQRTRSAERRSNHTDRSSSGNESKTLETTRQTSTSELSTSASTDETNTRSFTKSVKTVQVGNEAVGPDHTLKRKSSGLATLSCYGSSEEDSNTLSEQGSGSLSPQGSGSLSPQGSGSLPAQGSGPLKTCEERISSEGPESISAQKTANTSEHTIEVTKETDAVLNFQGDTGGSVTDKNNASTRVFFGIKKRLSYSTALMGSNRSSLASNPQGSHGLDPRFSNLNDTHTSNFYICEPEEENKKSERKDSKSKTDTRTRKSSSVSPSKRPRSSLADSKSKSDTRTRKSSSVSPRKMPRSSSSSETEKELSPHANKSKSNDVSRNSKKENQVIISVGTRKSSSVSPRKMPRSSLSSSEKELSPHENNNVKSKSNNVSRNSKVTTSDKDLPNEQKENQVIISAGLLKNNVDIPNISLKQNAKDVQPSDTENVTSIISSREGKKNKENRSLHKEKEMGRNDKKLRELSTNNLSGVRNDQENVEGGELSYSVSSPEVVIVSQKAKAVTKLDDKHAKIKDKDATDVLKGKIARKAAVRGVQKKSVKVIAKEDINEQTVVSKDIDSELNSSPTLLCLSRLSRHNTSRNNSEEKNKDKMNSSLNKKNLMKEIMNKDANEQIAASKDIDSELSSSPKLFCLSRLSRQNTTRNSEEINRNQIDSSLKKTNEQENSDTTNKKTAGKRNMARQKNQVLTKPVDTSDEENSGTKDLPVKLKRKAKKKNNSQNSKQEQTSKEIISPSNKGNKIAQENVREHKEDCLPVEMPVSSQSEEHIKTRTRTVKHQKQSLSSEEVSSPGEGAMKSKQVREADGKISRKRSLKEPSAQTIIEEEGASDNEDLRPSPPKMLCLSKSSKANTSRMVSEEAAQEEDVEENDKGCLAVEISAISQNEVKPKRLKGANRKTKKVGHFEEEMISSDKGRHEIETEATHVSANKKNEKRIRTSKQTLMKARNQRKPPQRAVSKSERLKARKQKPRPKTFVKDKRKQPSRKITALNAEVPEEQAENTDTPQRLNLRKSFPAVTPRSGPSFRISQRFSQDYCPGEEEGEEEEQEQQLNDAEIHEGTSKNVSVIAEYVDKTPDKSNLSIALPPVTPCSGPSFRLSRRASPDLSPTDSYDSPQPKVSRQDPGVKGSLVPTIKQEDVTPHPPSCLRGANPKKKKSLGRKVSISNIISKLEISRHDNEEGLTYNDLESSLPSPSSSIKHYAETTTNNQHSPVIDTKKDLSKFYKDPTGLPLPDLSHRITRPPTAPTPGVRRSRRTRIQPINHDRGERCLYKRNDTTGEMEIHIKPSIGEAIENFKKEQRRKRIRQRKMEAMRVPTKRKDKRLSMHVNLEDDIAMTDEFPVLDPETEEEKTMELVSRSKDVKWFDRDLNADPWNVPYAIGLRIQQQGFITGDLQLGPLATKDTSKVSKTQIYTVIKSKFSLTINDVTTTVQAEDQFFVPKGSLYSLQNLRKEVGTLLFVSLPNPSV